MKSLFCIVVLAMMAMASARNLSALSTHQRDVMEEARGKADVLRKSLSGLQTRQTITPACAAHLSEYDNMGCNTDYLNVIALMSGEGNPLDEFDDIVPADFCAAGEAGCHDKLFGAIPDCVAGSLEEGENLEQAVAEATIGLSIYTSMACIKAGDEYCFPKFELLFGDNGMFSDDEEDEGNNGNDDDDFNPAAMTNQQLDAMCDPCTQKVLGFVMALQALEGLSDGDDPRAAGDQQAVGQQGQGQENRGPPLDVLMTLMCMKNHKADGTHEYCFKKVATEMGTQGCFGDDEEGHNPAERMVLPREEDACFDIMITKPCTDVCYRRVFGMMAEHPKIFSDDDDDEDDFKAFHGALRYACRKNAAGELCGTKLDFGKHMDDSFDGTCTEETLFSDKCGDAGCKTALESVAASDGCCLGSALAFATEISAEAAVVVPTVISSCTTIDFTPCARTGRKVTRKALLKAKGLCAWYNANKAAADAALVKDMAANLGLDEEAITLIESTCTAAGKRQSAAVDELSGTIEITTDDDAHADEVEQTYDAAVEDNNLSFNNFVEDFQEDAPGVAVEFDNEQTAKENSSSMVAASLSTVFAVFAVLALLL